MTPLELLQNARADGVAFVLKDGGLSIRGDKGAAQKWADILRPHKADLLALVAQEVAQKTPHTTPAGEHLQTPEPSQTAMHRQADNSPAPNPADWRAVRDAYYSHHHACPVCIAAGKGYGLRCGAGASLWAAYSATPWPGYSRR